MNPDLVSLFTRAEAYAKFAAANLTAQSRADDVLSSFGGLESGTWDYHGKRVVHMIHFMFPNVTDADRFAINRLHMLSRSLEAAPEAPDAAATRQSFHAQRAELGTLEKHFSALQIQALDSDLFNWPGNHRL